MDQGQKGLTETLGKQVTGIVTPVSICMALTVALVRILNPDGVSGSSAVAIATVYYVEEADDSNGEKFIGAIVNAVIFIGIVGGMTFVLFLLFKYRCYKVIYAYMGFAGFNIFFFLSGTLALKVLQAFHLPVDAVTFVYVLYNFAIVGMLSLFFMPVAITMKQGYLIITGIVVAYIFTLIPEWTTWVMLIAMALYDLCAVLIPGGPLKVLVELAIERNEEIPALVYESRPVRTGQAPGQWSSRRRQQQQQGPGPVAESREDAAAAAAGGGGGGGPSREQHIDPRASVSSDEAAAAAAAGAPLVPSSASRQQQASGGSPARLSNGGGPRPAGVEVRGMLEDDDDDDLGIPDSIKLGLGDFIFYSVLVGRASMYDLITVFASYLAIVAGLGLTLLCLAVFQKALPALPFSIALGVAFYFLARLLLEPFLVPMVVNGLYF